jgi:hypothetical protein
MSQQQPSDSRPRAGQPVNEADQLLAALTFLEKTRSLSQLAEQYGVSQNAIRRWTDRFRARVGLLSSNPTIDADHYWDKHELTWRSSNTQGLLRDMTWLTSYDTETRFVWRGQGDYSWKLVPSLYRRLYDQGNLQGPLHHELLLLHERTLLQAAADRSLGDTRWGDLGMMAILQHHGASTRLLDVSLDPMIALWFAVEGPAYASQDALVAAFDISRLRQVPRSMASQQVGGYSEISYPAWKYSLEEYLRPDELAWFEPPQADERIKVQRGLFLVSRHATGTEADFVQPVLRHRSPTLSSFFLEHSKSRPSGRPMAPAFVAFRIKASWKRELLRHLERSYGYTYETIFPDLQGFALSNSASREFSSIRRPQVRVDANILPIAIGEKVSRSVIPHLPGQLSTLHILRGKEGVKISERWVKYWWNSSIGAIDPQGPIPGLAVLIDDETVTEVFSIRHESWREVGSRSASNPAFTCDLMVASPEERAKYLSAHLTDENGGVIRVVGRGWYVLHLGDPPKVRRLKNVPPATR